MDTTDTASVFYAALEHARSLQSDRDDLEAKRLALRELNATVMGENNQLREQVTSLQAALNVAVDTANIRKNMVVELTAQISMLGKLFIHCSDEVVKIVAALPKTPVPETKITGTENLEVEMLGPLVGVSNEDEALKAMMGADGTLYPPEAQAQEVDKATIPFAQRGREHLLSETVIPTPAFLHQTPDTISADQLSRLTYLERRNYVRNGIVPSHIRRFSSG